MILSEKTDLSFFHDSRVGEINYNYASKSLIFHLCLDSSSSIRREVELKANIVFSVELNSIEPWGPGIYINEVTLEDKIEFKRLSIIINSGDIFVIDANLFEIII